MSKKPRDVSELPDEALWYKDGVIYQLHVRAFYDSNGDGIGDFRGLTQKLDYLEDLGVTTLWLLPFYPSPLRDDGYDIADYTDVNPSYGTLQDFRTFLREAHRRGLKVITELVINHTSDQHEWFQRSRHAPPGSKWRDFYVWSDTAEKYREARIIFKDFETSNWSWDPVARQYFWHRFYHHQPDLNFDNPAVHQAVTEALDFWMEMGVDGMRLDAVPYLYEREGTSCENLEETHDYLKKLRSHVDGTFENRMLLAEANQWPEDSRPYFGDGDECHMAFHFPLMPRLFMSVAMEDRYPIVDIMKQTPEIPEISQWALFLRNHDELTLEMVTDEDRDYMYRIYARDRQARINLGIRRRLAPLLENHRARIELLNGLLFSFPGTPIVYYGDEIGMGDNIYLGDRNGVRTPMQWSADRNAGFSRANPQRLFLPTIIDPEYHYESLNVEAQLANAHSLLWWMRRLIALRKRYLAFGRGTLEFLHPENRRILAFVRQYGEQTILVLANLSRNVQYAELDLSRWEGAVPVELSGQTRFPRIGSLPYLMTLTGHSFMWLELRPAHQEPLDIGVSGELPLVGVESWADLVGGRGNDELDHAILRWMKLQRWFGGKARDIGSVELDDVIQLDRDRLVLALVRVRYVEGLPDVYLIPLAVDWLRRSSDEAGIGELLDGSKIARIGESGEGLIYEASGSPQFASVMMRAMRSRKPLRGGRGEITAIRGRSGRDDASLLDPSLPSRPVSLEQSNTAIMYGDKAFLKFFRRVEEGLNPDLEISRFLTVETKFRNTPELISGLRYVMGTGESFDLAILTRVVKGGEDAWDYTLTKLEDVFRRVDSSPELESVVANTSPEASLVDLAFEPLPSGVLESLGELANDARTLGVRTAEMHMALASAAKDPAFTPEPFSPHYQRSVFESMRVQTSRSLDTLRRRMPEIPDTCRGGAADLLAREPEILQRFRGLIGRNITTMRIRTHGDFHLGQVLRTGEDFVILDFEGEPSRALSERRLKRSPLRDVAGMIRSWDYAAWSVISEDLCARSGGGEARERRQTLATWWSRWMSAVYLRSYLDTAGDAPFLPQSRENLRTLLDAYLLEKALYEVQYELNHRPDWVEIPLFAILRLLDEKS